MLEFTTTFTPADGSAPRTMTVRIQSPTLDEERGDWWIEVQIDRGQGHGFRPYDCHRVAGADWFHAVSVAASFASTRLLDIVEVDGGGTLDPPFSR